MARLKSEAKEVINMQKYEIITDQNDENYGHIRALTDFGDVKKVTLAAKLIAMTIYRKKAIVEYAQALK